MKTNVRDTSIEAYDEMKGSGKLTNMQRKVLDAMATGRDYSRAELAKSTGMQLSSICGRVFELKEKGRIAEAPIRPCKITGKTVHPVFRVPGVSPG